MKTRLLLSVIFAVACTSAFAQTTVTGVNVTKFEATSVEAQPKMLVTPIAADISIIQATSSSFKTQGTIVIPEVPDTKDPAKLERYAADLSSRKVPAQTLSWRRFSPLSQTRATAASYLLP